MKTTNINQTQGALKHKKITSNNSSKKEIMKSTKARNNEKIAIESIQIHTAKSKIKANIDLNCS